jgi:uncharacterized membrane protein YsdA (DUF1294 family)
MTNELKLIIFYGTLNALVFMLIKIDKQRAVSNRRRIPEKTLWQFSFLGGCFGLYIAMNMFHHKTRKLQFRIGAIVLCILHSMLIITTLIYL